MLVAHGPHGDELAGIFEGAGQRILDHFELRVGIFLRKTPDLAAGGDRRIIVEIHLGDEIDLFAVEPRGDHQARIRCSCRSRSCQAS